MNKRHVTVVSLVFMALIVSWGVVRALPLTYVSDLISTSAPSTAASHTIQFTLPNAIPASGHIVITPQVGAFTIPASFDYLDVDLAVAAGAGPYVDRTLASTASVTDDGVSVVTGSSGSITITLNSTTGIAAGEHVQIELGAVAGEGGIGVHSIVNPSTQASYRVYIVTSDQVSAAIDSGTAMIAVVNQVSVSASPTQIPPVLSNGLPSGEIAAGSNNVELSFDTDILAHCRYATTTGVAYSLMTNNFSPTTGTSFYTVVTGLADATTYTYYVRCAELQGVANDSDYPISFSLASTPAVTTSGPAEGSGIVGSGGTGPYRGGSSVLYLATVTLSGTSLPLSTVRILVDGKITTNVQVKDDGSFKTTVADLERGVYTFQLYALDSKGEKSGTVSSTLTLGSGSNNSLSGIKLLFGKNASSSSIATSTSSSSVTAEGSDLNGDKKINLTDFSILLSAWGTDNPDVDLNKDSTINLADFSILLFNWTG
jgi:hypothetical protein